MMNTAEIEQLLGRKLSKKRLKHVFNVREQAILLGKKYHENIDKCRMAALLHDVTKEFKFDNQLQMIIKSGIIVSDILMRSEPLYHAVSGAVYARDELGVHDADILNAVRYHTTGRANMSKLEKIIFIADATSADRKYKDAQRFRELSFVDLDICMLELIKHEMRYLLKDACLIPVDTLNAYNEYIIKHQGSVE